jgi:hypothetical protein
MISFVSLPLNPFLPFGYFFRTLALFPRISDFYCATWHIFKFKVPCVIDMWKLLPWERRVKSKTRVCHHIYCLLLCMCISTFRQVLVWSEPHKTARILPCLKPPRHLLGAFTKIMKFFQTSIQDIPVSNLGRGIGYLDRWFYSGCPGKFRENTLIRLRPLPSKSSHI